MLLEFESIRIELANILEVPLDQLSDDAELEQFETWDSLSKVTLIALLIDKTGSEINLNALENARTVSGIRQLLPGVEGQVRT